MRLVVGRRHTACRRCPSACRDSTVDRPLVDHSQSSDRDGPSVQRPIRHQSMQFAGLANDHAREATLKQDSHMKEGRGAPSRRPRKPYRQHVQPPSTVWTEPVI